MLADKDEDLELLLQFTVQTDVHCWSWVLLVCVALYATNSAK